MIPARLFVAWIRESASLTAATQLRQVYAIQLGAAAALDPKQLGVKRAIGSLKRAARG